MNPRSSNDGRNGSILRNASPKGAKGVSFEATQIFEENQIGRRDRDHSSSTDPLVTDSGSDDDQSRVKVNFNNYCRVNKVQEI